MTSSSMLQNWMRNSLMIWETAIVSPFGRYFNNVLVTCQERIKHLEIQHESTFEDNEYFLPRLPTILATHYIPICPLWTSLILDPVLCTK